MSQPYDPYRPSEPEPTFDPYRAPDPTTNWTPPASPTQDAPSPYGYAAPPQDFGAPGYPAPPVSPYASPAYAQQQPGTLNQMALVGFIASLVGTATCIGFVVGLILGHVGLRQIQQQPQQTGRGLAIAAIVIGYVGLALYVIGIALFIFLGTRSYSTY